MGCPIGKVCVPTAQERVSPLNENRNRTKRMRERMLRVQKLHIKCPICKKPDWCLIADDGTACICTRISEGSTKKVGKAGWLHITGDFKPIKYRVPEKKYVDWNRWATRFTIQLGENREAFGNLCKDIGLNPISTLRFYIGWHRGWLTIPVYGLDGKIAGIQRRQGKVKRYMKHSSMGVFVPSAFFQNPSEIVAVTEGWTDTVTALEYGYNAIGRVNAWVGNEEVLYYVKRKKATKVLFFADRNDDGVGLAGAEECRDLLDTNGLQTRVILTPEKDLRKCKQKNMTIQEVMGD